MYRIKIIIYTLLIISYSLQGQSQDINCEKYEKLLENLEDESLALRIALRDTIIRYGHDSPEKEEVIKLMNYGDSLLLVQLDKIVKQCGFQLTSEMSQKSYSGVFLVVAHAQNVSTFQKYAKLIQEEAKENKELNRGLATLIDRIMVNQQKRQLYGTQYGSNKYPGYVWPIKNYKKINKRRLSMGLNSFEEFLRKNNLHYADTISVDKFLNKD